MELQIQNEKIDIKKSIGTKKKTINIEKDYILPDSKPDIIKVQNENANVFIVKKENMENKLKLEGESVLRITYLTSEGKTRVLKIEDTFAEILDFQGLTETSYINEEIKVTSIQINILNERKIHFRLETEYIAKASKKENIEFIHEINPVHQLQTLNKTMKINSYIGHGETKINLQEKMEIENLQENIEIVKIEPTITNIEKKMSYNKVLVKADCMIKCLYITETGMAYITKKEVPIMGFLDIENVEDTNECNINFSMKRLEASENEKEVKPTINIEMEFNVVGDVYQEKEINILEDLYCLNNKTNYKTQKVILEGSKEKIIQSSKIKEKVVIENINQIYDAEYKIQNIQVIGKYIEGNLSIKYLYSTFENPTINKKETTVKFQIALETETSEVRLQIINSKSIILPDSSIDTEIDVEISDSVASKNEIQLINEITLEEENDDDGYSMIVYFVKQGDSLWKIAKKFKSTVNEIANVNEIADENKIQIGDKLYIPRAI